MTDLKAAVFTVLEGWALPLDARKILETAYYAQPEQEFYPDWDMIQPYHDRIAELEAQLAQPEQELCKAWVGLTQEERNEMIGRVQHDQYTRQRDLIGKTQIITEMYLKERNT